MVVVGVLVLAVGVVVVVAVVWLQLESGIRHSISGSDGISIFRSISFRTSERSRCSLLNVVLQRRKGKLLCKEKRNKFKVLGQKLMILFRRNFLGSDLPKKTI